MTEPRVPGDSPSDGIELPCGEAVPPSTFDLGMREYSCACGQRHAVVLDVHPPSRFFPEPFVDMLVEMIETDDDFEAFGTPHLLGIVLEEFPEDVVVHDASSDGTVGYALGWITTFDSRRLHSIIVELVIELMEHAISHAEDESIRQTFEEQMFEFDIDSFVDEYRSARDFEGSESHYR